MFIQVVKPQNNKLVIEKLQNLLAYIMYSTIQKSTMGSTSLQIYFIQEREH